MAETEYPYFSGEAGCAAGYLVPEILELLPRRSPLRILDLGCGNGSITHLLAQQGHQVVGIDSSSSGIEFARQSYPECQFIEGDLANLPDHLRRGAFDVATAIEVVEHLPYPRNLLRSAMASLRDGGVLIVSTPYHGYLKNLVLALSGKLDEHFTSLWDGGHVKFFSTKTLTTLLESEGFKILEFRFAGRLPLLWKSMLCSAQKPAAS